VGDVLLQAEVLASGYGASREGVVEVGRAAVDAVDARKVDTCAAVARHRAKRRTVGSSPFANRALYLQGLLGVPAA